MSAEVPAVRGGARPRLVGRWSAHARTFLLLFAAITTMVGAVPIYLFPTEWAKALGWSVPHDTDLLLYYGRGGGSFLLIAEFLMLRAAITRTNLRLGYEVLLLTGISMVVLHVWGALHEAQPLSETIEIGFYTGVALVPLLFWPPSER
jgi:hypothetical protein